MNWWMVGGWEGVSVGGKWGQLVDGWRMGGRVSGGKVGSVGGWFEGWVFGGQGKESEGKVGSVYKGMIGGWGREQRGG